MIPGKLDIQLYRAASHNITIDVNNSLGAPFEIVGTNQLRIYRNYNEAAILTVPLTWNGTALVGTLDTDDSDIEAGSYPYHLWNVDGLAEKPVLRGMVQVADVFVGNFVDVDSSIVVDSVTYQVTVANIVSTSKIVAISDFGAKGDGSDETAILQFGIDASAGVYTLVIDKPVKVTSTITLPDNTDIVGDEKGSILPVDAVTIFNVFQNAGYDAGTANENISIRNLKVDGSGVPVGATGNGAIIRVSDVSNFRMEGCYLENVALHGVQMRKCTDFLIRGNKFIKMGNANITVVDPGGGIQPQGVAIRGPLNKYGVISENYFNDCPFGFILMGGGTEAVNPGFTDWTGHITIANNVGIWARDNGIRIDNDVTANDTVRNYIVTGNQIIDVRGSGIRLQGNGHTITGNQVVRRNLTSATVGKNTPLGIWVGGKNHTITGNVIRDESDTTTRWMNRGILIHTSYLTTNHSENIVIADNVIANVLKGIEVINNLAVLEVSGAETLTAINSNYYINSQLANGQIAYYNDSYYIWWNGVDSWVISNTLGGGTELFKRTDANVNGAYVDQIASEVVTIAALNLINKFITIKGNIITDVWQQNGIEVIKAESVVICDNQVNLVNGNGILTEDCLDVIVNGNMVKNCNTANGVFSEGAANIDNAHRLNGIWQYDSDLNGRAAYKRLGYSFYLWWNGAGSYIVSAALGGGNQYFTLATGNNNPIGNFTNDTFGGGVFTISRNAGIRIDNTDSVIIINNRSTDDRSVKLQSHGIYVHDTCDWVTITNNHVHGNVLQGHITGIDADGAIIPTNITFRGNTSRVNEACGMIEFDAAETVKTVTLSGANALYPVLSAFSSVADAIGTSRVSLTPRRLGNAKSAIVTSIGTTGFVVTLDAAPGAGGALVAWQIGPYLGTQIFTT